MTTSLLTNTAALSSLSALKATQGQLATTQAQIASGLAVADASDNAAYWSIGQTMSTQVAGLSAVRQGLGLTKAIAAVTSNALTSIIASVRKIQDDLVAARSSGVDPASIQSDIRSQQSSILATVQSAGFNGVNWLASTSTDAGYNEDIHRYDGISQSQDEHGFSGAITDRYTFLTESNGVRKQVDQTYSATYVSPGVLSEVPTGSPTITYSQSTYGATDDVPVLMSIGSDGSVTRANVDLSKLTVLNPNTGNFIYADTIYFSGVPKTPSAGYQATDEPIHAGILGSLIPGVTDAQGAPVSLMTMDLTSLSAADIGTVQSFFGTAAQSLIDASTTVGSLLTQVSTMQDFDAALSDALTSGVGSLVDADMNLASTRLQALQVQEQLGIQALSIANQDGQLVLKLFEAA